MKDTALSRDASSHELPLDDIPDAYDKFDKHVDGYTKVSLKPGMSV